MCTSARWRNYIYKTLCFDSFDSFPPLLSMAALSVEHLKVRVYLLGGGVSMAALTVEHLKVLMVEPPKGSLTVEPAYASLAEVFQDLPNN